MLNHSSWLSKQHDLCFCVLESSNLDYVPFGWHLWARVSQQRDNYIIGLLLPHMRRHVQHRDVPESIQCRHQVWRVRRFNPCSPYGELHCQKCCDPAQRSATVYWAHGFYKLRIQGKDDRVKSHWRISASSWRWHRTSPI